MSRIVTAVALGLTMFLATPSARAYAEFGYYTGAYATPGESGCWGSDGQGTNPYGGCTPGTFPLAIATAFVYGVRGQNNFATATADLSHASVTGSSHFPGGAGNSPGSAANFMDTITIIGNLPAPVDIVVTLTIDSTISGPPADEAGPATPVQAVLLNGGGVQAVYNRDLGSCYWSVYGGAQCDLGYGHTLRTITHTETVDNANRSFQVLAALYVGGVYMDVDASATLSFALPQGLGYSSASGLFAASVPEPGNAPMWLAGLGALGLAVRRRLPIR